jgi:hypothetical protein
MPGENQNPAKHWRGSRKPTENAMKKFAFAALAVTSIIWGATAAALWQSPQEPRPVEDIGWSITETGAAPGWSVTPAHARMW